MISSVELEKILNGDLAISSACAVKEAQNIISVWKEIEEKISDGESLHKIEQSFIELIEKSFVYGKDVGYKEGFEKGYKEGLEITNDNNFER